MQDPPTFVIDQQVYSSEDGIPVFFALYCVYDSESTVWVYSGGDEPDSILAANPASVAEAVYMTTLEQSIRNAIQGTRTFR